MNNDKFRGKYRTTSHRLKGYDYTSDGAYFITIVTKNREHFFGKIMNGEMVFNGLGGIANGYWKKIPDHFPDVILDEFIIMPNHIHGILFLQKSTINIPRRDKKFFVSTNNQTKQKPSKHGTSRTIGSIVRGFKIGVTKYARENTNIYDVWQRNYHDRIIRNDNELNRIREYIINNPQMWECDRNNQGLWI